jgi:hypothetical protein
MAKKDTLTANGAYQECLNVDQPVGKNQRNLKEDVMLIQAMFKKLAELKSPAFLGLRSRDAVPEPTGNFDDGKTENAIWAYQRKNAKRSLRVDGVIHPAAYENRNIKVDFTWATNPLMTITLLHFDLQTSTRALFGFNTTYIEEIKRMVPCLPLGNQPGATSPGGPMARLGVP